MAGEHGVVELKEIVLFIKTLTLRVVEEAKGDGFQPADLEAILTDPQVIQDFFAAFQGSTDAVKEAKELDFDDAIDLSKFVFACVTEIIKEMRK